MSQQLVQLNVFGNPLIPCCKENATGFFRTGYCQTHPQDFGEHTACALMTDEFLNFSRYLGNDLITTRPEFQFPGLKAGDFWCICAKRWMECFDNDITAPKLNLHATHMSLLSYMSIEQLKKYEVTS